MAFLVGSLKIIISDVPDNVKLQVCVSCKVLEVLPCDIIITSPLSPPSPQTQREKLLARESLFEAELKDATEKNILEDTTEPGSGQR